MVPWSWLRNLIFIFLAAMNGDAMFAVTVIADSKVMGRRIRVAAVEVAGVATVVVAGTVENANLATS
jgi:hypothetical protein